MPEKVTWLMPVKNGMPYIRDTLASIAAQDYRHFEILVWENGSTDGTVEELQRWIPQRLPGRVILDQPLRLGASRAALINMAQTELCAFSDSDDVHLPERLGRQVAFMQEHPEVALLGTNIQLIDERGGELPGSWTLPTDDAAIRWRMRFASAMLQGTAIVRKSAVIRAGNYRDIMPGQDYDLWMRIGMFAKLANLPERLLQYRKRPGSVSTLPAVRGVAFNRQLVERYVDALFPDMPAHRALRLHTLLVVEPTASVEFMDCVWLYRAATRAALALGETPSYFRNTALYRQQQRDLAMRWIKQQPGVATVWHWLKGMVQQAHSKGLHTHE